MGGQFFFAFHTFKNKQNLVLSDAENFILHNGSNLGILADFLHT